LHGSAWLLSKTCIRIPFLVPDYLLLITNSFPGSWFLITNSFPGSWLLAPASWLLNGATLRRGAAYCIASGQSFKWKIMWRDAQSEVKTSLPVFCFPLQLLYPTP
jgi:hypothetical protein